jgi:hypothetical protein
MEQPFRFGVVPALRGARVLLVEDDVFLLMELEAILRDAGADCRLLPHGAGSARRYRA